MKISVLAALCSLCPHAAGFGLTSPSVARSMQPLTQARGSRRVAPLAMEEGNFFSKVLDSGAKAGNFFSDAASKALDGGGKADSKASGKVAAAAAEEGDSAATTEEDDGKMTIEKVASFGIAGILSIAVAESVFWILSFPCARPSCACPSLAPTSCDMCVCPDPLAPAPGSHQARSSESAS